MSEDMIVTPYGPYEPFSPEEVEEILQSLSKPPIEVTKNLRRMLDDLDQGLPKAASSEVLGSRTNFRVSKAKEG